MTNPTIILTNLNLVLQYNLDSVTDECTLCRRPLMLPSIQEININSKKPNIINGNVIIGECKHIFHKTCFENLENTGVKICPIDKTIWKTSEIIKSNITSENNIFSTKSNQSCHM